jgi:hypothetical protein
MTPVDPSHRLVAGELERRWNAALDAVAAQERVATELVATAPNGVPDRAALLALAEDLPSAWRDARTDVRLKKRIVRSTFSPVTMKRPVASSLITRLNRRHRGPVQALQRLPVWEARHHHAYRPVSVLLGRHLPPSTSSRKSA